MVDPETISAARSRWRADLLRLHADDLDTSAACAVPSVAGALTGDAASKRDAADLYEIAADLDDEYLAKRQAYADGQIDRDEWKTFVAHLASVRSYWRSVGEMSGARGGPAAVMSEFPEPSDVELLEALS